MKGLCTFWGSAGFSDLSGAGWGLLAPVGPSSLMECFALKRFCATGVPQPNYARVVPQEMVQALKWFILAFNPNYGFENIQQLSYLQGKFWFFMLCYGDCHIAEQLKIKHQQHDKDENTASVLGTDSISPSFQDILQYLAPPWEDRPLL